MGFRLNLATLIFISSMVMAVALLIGFYFLPPPPPPISDTSNFLMTDLNIKDIRGCKSIVDNYCHQLHSKEARGNLRIKRTDKNESLTTAGSTINNFDSSTYAFHKARLKQRNKLPTDLNSSLLKRNFYQDLEMLLSRPPRTKMTLHARIYYSDLESEVDSKWDQAIDEVVLRRLSKKFPNLHGLDDNNIPPEVEVEYTRAYYSLWTEISAALWRDNARWIKITAIFAELKVSFRNVINDLHISDQIKKGWLAKIESVKLRTPGFNPAIASRDCISISRNAYYYPYLNTITVCAGYLNTGEQIQTLAHELAHAIDHSSRLTDFLKSSPLQNSFRVLRTGLCKNKKLSCEDWTQFTSQFENNLAQLRDFNPETYAFNRCLKKSSDTLPFNREDQDRVASQITDERFSNLIKNSALFRITKKQIPLGSGEQIKNASYLNPCDYFTWDSDEFALDGALPSLLLFTAAYQCSEGDELYRTRVAIDSSKIFTQQILSSIIGLEGEFSSRSEMQEEHFSSPSSERFADRLGSYIVADFLKRRAQTPEDLRALFLSSSYWLCDTPNLKSRHLEEYQSLSDIIIDRSSYEDNSQRIMDWLSPSVREILACEKDFEHDECSLSD